MSALRSTCLGASVGTTVEVASEFGIPWTLVVGMRRAGRFAATAIMPMILAAACGSTSEADVYTNPTTGPLPTFASIDSLSRAVDPTCTWTVLPASSSGGSSRFCAGQYLIIVADSPSDGHGTSTVESVEFNAFLDDPQNLSHACVYWNSMSRVAFAGLPSAVGSGGRKSAAAIVYGGNWIAASATVEEGQKVAAATGAYLTTVPRGCPSSGA